MFSSGLFVSSQQNVFLVTTFLAGEQRQKQSEYFARCWKIAWVQDIVLKSNRSVAEFENGLSLSEEARIGR